MTNDEITVPEGETNEPTETPEQKPFDTQKIKSIFESVLNDHDFVTRDALASYVTKTDLDKTLSARIAPIAESIVKLTNVMKELSDSQKCIDELNAKLDTFITIRTTELQNLQSGHEKQMGQIGRNSLEIEKNGDQIKNFSNAIYGENGLMVMSQDFTLIRPKINEMYQWHNTVAGAFRKWAKFARTRTGGAATIAALITGIKVVQTLDIDAIGNMILALVRLVLSVP